MGTFADRVDRHLSEHDHDLWDQHEDGEHRDAPEPDCSQCQRDEREAANREGDPAFNGAFG